VVKVLETRGIAVGDAARRRISDQNGLEELEVWLERAARVATVEELFGGRR
jgi:hypothetical protein